ncbi:MAG: hypothetical protein NTZ72_07570 [Afipia sp.]|jgi:hypothetical protein|nr:hypothetical protein [Afipia sp.]
MTEAAKADSQTESERLDVTADQAIAACGGDLRSTIRALILANEYLEHEVCDLMQAVSHAYTRGRLKPYSG